MARTANGNLTGRAAAEHLREFREYLDSSKCLPPRDHVMNICKQIQLLDPAGYGAWLEAQSDNNADFSDAAKKRLTELEQKERAELAGVIEWLDPPAVSTGLERDGAATGISQSVIF